MPENTQQRQSSCPVWICIALFLGLLAVSFIFYLAATKKSLMIQEDIQTRTSQNISQEALLSDVTTLADGRDITLTGQVPSQEWLVNAENIATHTYGVRVVDNQLSVSKAESRQLNNDSNQVDTMSLQAKVETLPDEFAPLEQASEDSLNEDTELVQDELAAQHQAAQEQLSQLDFSNITFEKNSAALTQSSRATLDNAIRTLLENPAVKINVEGHTDTSGNPESNLQLSKQRAESVLDYLVAGGVDESRIQADGYGDQFPIAPNDTQAGRIKNRRIEIKVNNGD